MAFFKQKTDEELAAEAARAAEKAFWGSPQGQALKAFERGDEFYQVEIPHSSVTGFTNAAFNSSTAGKIQQKLTRTDLLGQIEEAGWHLEHADWVYIQTGQNSRDKFLASGQHVVVTGEVVGIYLFRRDDTRTKRTKPPSTVGPAKVAQSTATAVKSAAPKPSVPTKLASRSSAPTGKKPTDVLRKGMRVRVRAPGEESHGMVGTFKEHLEDDGDGLTVGVVFDGDPDVYGFSPGEIEPA